MAKIGEFSGHIPQEHPDPKKEMVEAARNFRQYLDDFNTTKDEEVKKHDMDRMVREMHLMDDLSKFVDKKETRVQEQRVSKDFSLYHQNPSNENYNVLEHDLNVLRESLEH